MNPWGIPDWLEKEVKERDKTCIYCGTGCGLYLEVLDGKVVGTLPVDFTAFDVTMPTAPVVLSVEDTGDLEWQLFFRRQAEASASADPASPAPEG